MDRKSPGEAQAAVSILSIGRHTGPDRMPQTVMMKLTEVRMSSGGRGWSGLRLAHGVEQRRRHKAHLMDLEPDACQSCLKNSPIFHLMLTKDGPFVAMD